MQTTCSSHPVACGRRPFLAGTAALAATGVHGRKTRRTGSTCITTSCRPAGSTALKQAKLDNPPLSSWTPQRSIEDMDKAGIATAITSPTTPQVGFLPAADAARIAREANEYAKQLTADHPGRFGVFAMLPMPYIDESLKEIEYVFDTLKVDGIGMMTSYGDKWLGYPQFAPVFDELNRRKATVYTHPTTANCCVNLVQGLSPATVEWAADTTRSIANLIFSGAAQRYGDIKLHLLARWRRTDRGRRTAGDTDGEHAALQGQVHARDGGRPAASLLLRHGAGLQRGDDRRAGEAGAGVADRVRHGLSVSDGRGTRARSRRATSAPMSCRAIDRDNALRILPRLGAA